MKKRFEKDGIIFKWEGGMGLCPRSLCIRLGKLVKELEAKVILSPLPKPGIKIPHRPALKR